MGTRRAAFRMRVGRWFLLSGFAFFAGFYALLLYGMGPTTLTFHLGYYGFASAALLPLALHQLPRPRTRFLFFGLLFGCLTLAAVLPSSPAEWELRRLRPGMTRGEVNAALTRWNLIGREVTGYPSCTWTHYYGPRDTPRINCAVLKFTDGRLTEYVVGWD
jgi:hypothetical protein